MLDEINLNLPANKIQPGLNYCFIVIRLNSFLFILFSFKNVEVLLKGCGSHGDNTAFRLSCPLKNLQGTACISLTVLLRKGERGNFVKELIILSYSVNAIKSISKTDFNRPAASAIFMCSL